MGKQPNHKTLLITNKNSPKQAQPEYKNDMQTIEQWAQDNTGGGGAYASLTGPGETASPGSLTQNGGFFVTDLTGEGIVLESSDGEIAIAYDAGGTGGGFFVSNDGGDPSINITFPGSIDLRYATGEGELILSASGVTLRCTASGQVMVIQSGGSLAVSGLSTSVTSTGGTCDVGSTGGNVNITSPAHGLAVNTLTLGFYNATPVAQAAAPTTLAQVITILTNLGLCA